MARQAGEIKITGSFDDLCFYKMYDEYFVRMKSSLTGKKFWKHPAFERSRESCGRFGKGNTLASKVYRIIEKEKRVYKLFCFLKKKAIQMLKEGKSLIEAEETLVNYLMEFGFIDKTPFEIKPHSRLRNCAVINKPTVNKDKNPKYKIGAKKTGLPGLTDETYACAVGPPKVIGI